MKTYFLTIKPIKMTEKKTHRIVAWTLFPYISDFQPDLATLQSLVGGYIEPLQIHPVDPQIDLWINEEGKLLEDQKITLFLYDGDRLVDTVVGPIVFARHDDDETVGLTEDDLSRIALWMDDLQLVQYDIGSGVNGYAFRYDLNDLND